jgi:hypothetical protein
MVWGFPFNLKHAKNTRLGLDLYHKLGTRTIPNPFRVFGLKVVSKGVFGLGFFAAKWLLVVVVILGYKDDAKWW